MIIKAAPYQIIQHEMAHVETFQWEIDVSVYFLSQVCAPPESFQV
jgi:hypothetical protein